MSDKQLPTLPIKITREGDHIKFKYGKYTLRLKELPHTSQTYSGLLLDKFLTETTTLMLKQELEQRNNRDATRKSLLHLGVDEAATDNVIRQIHEGLFPEGER